VEEKALKERLKRSHGKSEKDSKKKISRISRLGETKKLSLKENVHKAWKFFLSLLKEKFFLLFLLCLFIALVNAPSLFIPSKTYQVGEVADFDIKASQDILVEDKIVTDLSRSRGLSCPSMILIRPLDLQKRSIGVSSHEGDLKNKLQDRIKRSRSNWKKFGGSTTGHFQALKRPARLFENALIQWFNRLRPWGGQQQTVP
jgi:hypothetical protein